MKKFFVHLSRSTRTALEITLGLAIVLMIALGFSLWYMSRHPFDLMFAEDYIERALSAEHYTVTFEDVDLKWPEMRGPLRLGIQGLSVTTMQGDEAISVEQADIGLSSIALMAGMIRPVSLTITNPTMRLVQADDGQITFLMQGRKVAEEKAAPSGNPVESLLNFITNPQEDHFLRRFRRLNIANAQLVLEDAETKEEIQLSELNAQFHRTRTDISLNADMMINDALNNGIGGISVTMQYDRDNGALTADTVFKNLGPAILAKMITDNEMIDRQAGTVDGRFVLAMDGQRAIREFFGQIAVKDAEIYWPQEYETPLQMSALSLTLGYNPQTGGIESREFYANVQGVDVGGDIDIALKDKAYGVTVALKVPEIKQETLETFFPKSELDGELAEWLVHRMEGGTFRNVTARVPLGFAKSEDGTWAVLFSEADLYVGFEAEGVTLTYVDTLMPAEDIKGAGYFDGDKLVVNGESGRIADVQAHDVTVTIDDVAVKAGGYADIIVNAKGPLSTLLTYIAAEPIAMGEDIPFKPEEVKGTADVKVTVGLPTLADLPKEEVKVKVEGTLTDLSLPDVVQGLTLTEGPLTIGTMPGGFTLKGDAKLDGQPLTLDMTQYFSSAGRDFLTKVDAKIVSNADLRAKFGVDLSEYISGDAILDIAYADDGKGRESVSAKGDLTPTRLHITPFGYDKPAGAAGSLSLNAVMDQGTLTRVSDLAIEAKDLSVGKAVLDFRPAKDGGAELSGGNLPEIAIGASRGSADFSVSADNVLSITAQAPIFDARPFLETSGRAKQTGGSAPGDTQPMIIDLKAETVIGAHDQKMTGLALYTELDDEGDMTRLELSAAVGESPATVMFRPDAQTGLRTFTLETQDAGALLAAAGLYENVRGGTLRVFGAPAEGDKSTGNLIGTAQLENFNVVRAPALAKLFGLMSLGGLNDLLGQQGISFSKLEADFEWRFQPQGNLLLISNGRTSGSSVGLTFEGTIDRGAQTTDIRGTIIPMTEINNVLKNIPLIGNLLTGGSGLIAATYTMKGPSDDPSVMVNPLSVLAPGFLRTILFEGGFSKQRPGEAQEAQEAPTSEKKPVASGRTAGQ